MFFISMGVYKCTVSVLLYRLFTFHCVCVNTLIIFDTIGLIVIVCHIKLYHKPFVSYNQDKKLISTAHDLFINEVVITYYLASSLNKIIIINFMSPS